ncbi:LysR family transcriptional regulator [Agrobacterium pusense]|uniref:LysR family transcriptional regulator n=1 Tax=Agrobacterium pusense TaxID=648995 RepID=UPI003D10FB5B
MDVIGRLTLDQLRVLVTVVDEGGFSAAARRLGRVQSAVSQTVRALEETQGIELFLRGRQRPSLTPVGQVLVEQARSVLTSAARFEAVAAGTRQGLEPSLTLAIDPLVPTEPLIESMRALQATFPNLPVSFFTEGLGGAERRLRAGAASLAICLLLPSAPEDLMVYPLMEEKLVPVASLDHPLARARKTLTDDDLDAHVQLVLADGLDSAGQSYGVLSSKVWRFVDLARRLDFLLAGFGWCKMPRNLVQPHLEAGRLKELFLSDAFPAAYTLPIYAAHVRNQPLGRAGKWLLDDLRQRLATKERDVM